MLLSDPAADMGGRLADAVGGGQECGDLFGVDAGDGGDAVDAQAEVIVQELGVFGWGGVRPARWATARVCFPRLRRRSAVRS